VILDDVKPFALDEYSVKNRTAALTREEEISELVCRYYDSQRGDVDYVRRFYNFDEDTLRVIVFDDVATYRRFIRNVQRDDIVNKIKDQIHVVLYSAQSLVRATNFDMNAFSIIEGNHTELSKDNISSVLNTRKFEDKRTIKSILDDYEKAKRNAEKFESNMNSN